MFFAATRRRRLGGVPPRTPPNNPRAAGGDPPVPPALILCHLHCVAETTSCRYSDAPPTSCRREGSELIIWTACGRKRIFYAAARGRWRNRQRTERAACGLRLMAYGLRISKTKKAVISMFFVFARAISRRQEKMPQARTSVRNWGIFSQPTQKAPRKNKKKPATIYSPTQSPMQYHRRERA